ncbi:MAG TPA: lipopolysaccharide biosynthesis protein [Pyrinomonadaceae bacterium]|nr:lipopolysaccharide biosynthesis protein [Pyrinomonadaceae bacterium]
MRPAPEHHFRTDHLKADLGSRAARGGAVMVGAQALRFAVTMGSTMVLARLLTPEDYGLVGMVLVVTGFVAFFKRLGLSAATIQRPEINAEQVSTLFWVNVAVSVALAGATAALAPAVAWFYGQPQLVGITLAFAAGFTVSGLSVQHEALLKRQMRFKALAAIELGAMLAGIGAAIIAARAGAGYWALVLNQLVFGTLYAAGLWAACGWRPGPPVRYAGVRQMLSFGGDITGYGVLNYLARNLDNLLIGRVWGAAQLGLYARAYQLLLLPLDQTTVPLDSVAVPALSRLTDAPERYRQAYLRILEKVAMLTMPGVALMIATSDWLVRLVLGPQWDETARIFALLGVAGLFEPVANTMGWLLISQGRTRDMLRWGFVHAAVTTLSFAVGLPWGAVGVAASYSAFGVLVHKPLLFWYVGRRGPVGARDIYRAMAPSVCAAAGVLGALYLLRRLAEFEHAAAGLAACAALAAAVALLTFAVLPKGRAALQDVKGLLLLLTRRGESVA